MITLDLPAETRVSQVATYTIQTNSIEESLSIPEDWMAYRGKILVRIPFCDGLTVIVLEEKR